MNPIELPFPASILAGHNTGGWWSKSKPVKNHRDWAYTVTIAARIPELPPGDIVIDVHFYPPNLRGDRTNYGNRLKPYFDGIAQALVVNDRRFVPAYHYHDVDRKDPRVVFNIKAST